MGNVPNATPSIEKKLFAKKNWPRYKERARRTNTLRAQSLRVLVVERTTQNNDFLQFVVLAKRRGTKPSEKSD